MQKLLSQEILLFLIGPFFMMNKFQITVLGSSEYCLRDKYPIAVFLLVIAFNKTT